jgi:drug/metabolite transporter (DMT)-like permease
MQFKNNATNIKSVNLIIASQFIGVGSSIVLAWVAQGSDPMYLSFYRFLIGFVLLSPLLLTLRNLSKKTYLASFLYAADIMFFILALSLEKLVVVAAIVASGPVLAMLFERMRKHAKLSQNGILVIVLVAIGVFFAPAPQLINVISGREAQNILGIIFACLASITSAASIVFFKEKQNENPWSKTLAINVAGVALSVPILFITPFTLSTDLILGASVAAIGGGGVAIVLILAALKTLPGSIVMALGSIGIPLSAIGGVVFLNQGLTIYTTIAIIFITIATFISSIKKMTQ